MDGIRRYTWIGVLAAMALGLTWELPGGLPHWVVQGLLMTLLLLSCLELRPMDLAREALNGWAANLMVLAVVFLAVPLLLLPLRRLLAPATYAGLVLAGSMSTGLGVIFLAGLLGGSRSRALVLAVTASVLAPVAVPSVMSAFASRSVEIDFLAMSARTAFIVFVPLAAALALGRTAPGRWLSRHREAPSLAIFFTMIVVLVSTVRHIALLDPGRSLSLLALACALSLVCAGLAILAGGNRRQRITFAIAAGYRNFTLSTVLALTLFDEEVALPSVVYVLAGNLLVIGIQLLAPRRRGKGSA